MSSDSYLCKSSKVLRVKYWKENNNWESLDIFSFTIRRKRGGGAIYGSLT